MTKLEQCVEYYNSLSDKNKVHPVSIHLKMAIDECRRLKRICDEQDHVSAENVSEFLRDFNEATGKRFRTMCPKSRGNLAKLLRDGYTIADVITATEVCIKDEVHVETNLKYVTPEFITRYAKFAKFLNAAPEGAPASVQKPKKFSC